MPHKRFSISEAWSIMLIFFDGMWEFIEKNFPRDYEDEFIFFGLLNIDQVQEYRLVNAGDEKNSIKTSSHISM